MIDFAQLLVPGGVIGSYAASGKRAVLTGLGGVAAQALSLDPRSVADRLLARERLGSTGFGGGIAIPHAKIPSLGAIAGLFARLATPVDFAAVDDAPVDLVFLLLSPTDAGAGHLKTLAAVSRRLRDRSFVAKLRGAASSDALYALLTEDAVRDAA